VPVRRSQQLEDEVDRLFLDVAAAVEIAAEALELVRPVARAQARTTRPPERMSTKATFSTTRMGS
jgi:hypothetical protein